MCRNITALRGLEPAATPEEIRAAALQYVRKVGGLSSVSPVTEAAVNQAVTQIAAVTTQLLADLPARRTPPPTEPPLRRIAARRAGTAPAPVHSHEHEHEHELDHAHAHAH